MVVLGSNVMEILLIGRCTVALKLYSAAASLKEVRSSEPGVQPAQSKSSSELRLAV